MHTTSQRLALLPLFGHLPPPKWAPSVTHTPTYNWPKRMDWVVRIYRMSRMSVSTTKTTQKMKTTAPGEEEAEAAEHAALSRRGTALRRLR